MGYDPAVCLTNLQSKGLVPPGLACQQLNPPYHCEDIINENPAYHQACATAGIYYFPVLCFVCLNSVSGQSQYFPASTFIAQCTALAKTDPNWQFAQCYCCCSCLANDTLISVPGVEKGKPIFTINKGDGVFAASVTKAGAKISLKWDEKKVIFSQGTNALGHQPMMVYIVFGDKGTEDLICSTDQPFLLANGKYTTGGKLRPGQNLVGHDGQPIIIDMVSLGQYDGGVHHIATNVPWHKNPDGHLLLAAGVVVGDYTMQTFFPDLPNSIKEDGYDSLPLAGTKEYETKYKGIIKRSDTHFEFVPAGSESKSVAVHQMVSGVFKTYCVKTAVLPFGAQSLFTPDQAADILTNGSQAPLSNPIPLSIFNTITAQLAGFYPDIDFYYDTLDMTCNLYAFEAYGRKVVQISGGLGRLKGFNYEGMFMALSHGIACFYGGDPKNALGFSSVGQADWFAFGVISRQCWVNSPYITYVLAALSQWNDVFALVSPEHAKGNPLDPLNDPSLACRLQSIESAIAGGGLAECAGGKPLPKISLTSAAATSDSDIVVNFSLALDNGSGTDVANYTLSPAAIVTSATLDSATGFIVHLVADLKPGISYELKVQNLISILGTGLDPAHVTATFDSPKS